MDPRSTMIAIVVSVALLLAVRAGFVTVNVLRTYRRWVIVAIFAVAAVLTPADPISHLAVAIPMVLLYEVTLLALE